MKLSLSSIVLVVALTASTSAIAEPQAFTEEQKRHAREMQTTMEEYANYLGQLIAMNSVLECGLPVDNLAMTYSAYTHSLNLPENIRTSLSGRVAASAEALANNTSFSTNTKEKMDCSKGGNLYSKAINQLRRLISENLTSAESSG